MKVCLVTHQFLPDHRSGVEIYTHRLAGALKALGVEVMVYTTRKDLSRREGSLIEEEWEGVPVRRVVRNLFHEDFTKTFDDPLAEHLFETHVLEDFRPDLVHVHHLLHHSLGLPERAQKKAVPVLFTLHDYWLECPRFGQFLRVDGQLCSSADPGNCAPCLSASPWRNPPKLARVSTALRLLRQATSLDLQAPLQHLWRKRKGKRGHPFFADIPAAPGLEAALVTRKRQVLERLVPAVDRFLSPSEFLIQKMVAFGLPRDRMQKQPLGIPRTRDAVSQIRDLPAGPLRFGYLGSVLPPKGVHVLLDAWEKFGKEAPPGSSLSIHGGSGSDPVYGEKIRSRGQRMGVPVCGGYGPGEIGGLLQGLDVLVVPSLWYENSPVTILDARVRGIPCLVSDLGGMKELVPEPRLRFAMGDAGALSDRMRSLVEEGLRSPMSSPLPPSLEDDAKKTLSVYRSMCR